MTRAVPGSVLVRRALTRWWYAASKEVGPAPTLAPGLLGQTAVLLLLATVGGPLRRAER